MTSALSVAKGVVGSSSTLCTVATDIFYGCTVVIPEAFFCAQTVGDGKGDSGKIIDAAQAWWEVSEQYRDFHDELQGVAGTVSESEWKAADREVYEQKVKQYLQQVQTSSMAAEAATVMLGTAATALFAYATFATAVAGALAIDAAAVAAADCTVVGAPAAEAEANEAGAAAMEAMETATTVLFGALSGVAASMGLGALVDTGVQVGQGDTGALGDFGQATISGLKTDASMLPKEAEEYAKGKITDKIHEKAFPKATAGASASGGSSSGSGGSSSGGGGEE